ncbi:MAG: nickel-dependent lactate racemase [Sedimentisphaerales bacterium]|nr:nickel-dependent lactate racemase [Sedimentisphaerales bacterium]
MKTVTLQYGSGQVAIEVPDSADVLCGGEFSPLSDPDGQINHSLKEPIGSAPLSQLADGKKDAAIVVSDNTRPVPYKPPDGILAPIVETLKRTGINNIKIIVGCGTHRPMEKTELHQILGDAAFQQGVEIINHSAGDSEMLTCIGHTERTPEVTVNKYYMGAQLKIITGLVEPHFMAGFSGGRKAICPGICGLSVTYGFHSASILNDNNATTLVLKGNPCHEEALRIAKMAGADFSVNVTINSDRNITGVFSGDMEQSHLAAVENLKPFVTIELDKLYDVVITQAGDVGVNHYQCAKAVYETTRAVKPGGRMVLLAGFSDPDQIGSDNYRKMLCLLASLGPEDFVQRILSDEWSFVPDQWEVQMWAKAFQKLDNPKNLYTCAARLENCSKDLIPETNVASQIKRSPGEDDLHFTERIAQERIDELVRSAPNAKILVLPDGPYAIPVFSKT